jgi:deoxyribodipyrimidine photolyase-related protein
MTWDRPRHLVVVLGDQLDRNSTVLDGFDPARDRIWMAEVAEESTHVPSHQARIVLFLAAMRHFADELRARGWPVDYLALDSLIGRNGRSYDLGPARRDGRCSEEPARRGLAALDRPL